MGSTTLFGIIYGSYYTISVNFYLYLQYFQQKNFNFSKINKSQIDPKCRKCTIFNFKFLTINFILEIQILSHLWRILEKLMGTKFQCSSSCYSQTQWTNRGVGESLGDQQERIIANGIMSSHKMSLSTNLPSIVPLNRFHLKLIVEGLFKKFMIKCDQTRRSGALLKCDKIKKDKFIMINFQLVGYVLDHYSWT